jgi:hypothetical protein
VAARTRRRDAEADSVPGTVGPCSDIDKHPNYDQENHVTRLGSLLSTAGAFYCRIANRRRHACVLVGVLALGIRAAFLPWLPAPLPRITDEFSYLLAADTYASGRLTNPPHPMWQHFETLHVMQQPTYAAKYPPMQGLVLAFGQRFFHQPWVGVWLSDAAMCSFICWMLQGWLAPPWALLGALMTLLRLGPTSYWMNSYWGGAVAAAGAALVLGALPRLVKQGRLRYGVVFGLGVVVLISSRPYEGLVLVGAASLAMLWWLKSDGAPVREIARRAAPAAAIVLVGGAALVYQNYRVTGNALELPYQAYNQQYAAYPNFIWEHPRTDLLYRHQSIRDYWTKYEAGLFQEAVDYRTSTLLLNLLASYVVWFGWLPLAGIALVCPFALRAQEEKLTVVLLGCCLASILCISVFLPHYLAPFACLVFLRLTQAIQRVSAWRPAGRPVGGVLAMLILCSLAIPIAGEVRASFPPRPDLTRFGEERDSITRWLASQPGGHLVLVRYGPGHDPNAEWVYNAADIDRSRVVWAQEMGPRADAELLHYYSDRRVWLLDADAVPPKLSCAR